MTTADATSELKAINTEIVAATVAVTAHTAREIHIDILNQSTVLSDADCQKYVAAIQKQISNEFAEAWGIDAQLHSVGKGPADLGHWWLAVLDDSTVKGALGYHDLTPAGLPIGYVFAKTDLQSGALVSVTMSHELLEIIIDPYINLCAQIQPTTFAALESADAVESDADGYAIDGVQVSDFLLPSYFYGGSAPYDYRNLLKAPAPALRPDGYISLWTPGAGWTQKNGELIENGDVHLRAKARPHTGSRRLRRTIPLNDRLPSELK